MSLFASAPIWIKLYGSLLEDYEFNLLPDVAKAHLILIWLLASRMGNQIPNNATSYQLDFIHSGIGTLTGLALVHTLGPVERFATAHKVTA